MKGFNATTASYNLPNYEDGTTQYYPLHFYDVSSKYGGNSFGPIVKRVMYSTSANDYLEFKADDGMAMDGSGPVTGWEILKSGLAQTDLQSLPNSVMQWVRVDLLLRGIASRPVTYQCAFVQFPEVDLQPSVAHNTNRNKFWSDFIRPYLSNPLVVEPKSFNSSGKVRFLKTWSFKFQPDETTNKDSIPTQRRVTIFHRFNRFCNWVKKDGPGDIDIQTLDTTRLHPEVAAVGNNEIERELLPQPRARVYFMLWANVYDQLPNFSEASQAYWPQYDIDIRVKHVARNPS